MNKTLLVEAIKEGTVIDHIPAGQAFRIVDLLKMKSNAHALTIGLNLESQRLGRKDLIKITNRFLTPKEVGEIAVFAEHAHINIIRAYQVVEKMHATLPDHIKGILVCPNANCITQVEPIESNFLVETMRGEIRLRCHFCEGVFSRQEIREYRTGHC